jgi:hypothetical protein
MPLSVDDGVMIVLASHKEFFHVQGEIDCLRRPHYGPSGVFAGLRGNGNIGALNGNFNGGFNH